MSSQGPVRMQVTEKTKLMEIFLGEKKSVQACVGLLAVVIQPIIILHRMGFPILTFSRPPNLTDYYLFPTVGRFDGRF